MIYVEKDYNTASNRVDAKIFSLDLVDGFVKIIKSNNNEESYKILLSHSEIFKNLVTGYPINVAINRLDNNLKVGKENDWLDEEHLSLKQLCPIPNRFSWADNMPVMLQLQLSVLRDLHSKNNDFQKLLNMILNKFKRGVVSYRVWRDAFKIFSNDIKKGSRDANFRFFTDLELLVGYNLSGLTFEEKKVKVDAWCKGDISRGYDSDMYYGIYLEQCKSRFSGVQSNTMFLSFEEFLLSIPLWMSDGSSRGFKVKYNVNGEIKTSLSKKQAIGMGCDLEFLLKIALNKTENDFYSATEKIEPGRKGRLIISAPISQQLRMSYIEYCLQDLFKKAFPNVTIFKTANKQQDSLEKLMDLTIARGPNYVFFPADASNFDQNVSRQEVLIVLNIMREIVIKLIRFKRIHNDCLALIDLVIENFFDIPVKIDGVVVGLWQHGMPSGIKWTALLDSIINDLRFSTICKFLEFGDFGKIVVIDEKFTGDDISVVLLRVLDAVRLLNAYNHFNIEIHPNKNLLSFDFTEFLRKIYFRRQQYAYPNRMVTKFLFRLPENEGSKDIRALLTERCYSIFRMFNRSANIDLGYYWCEDMIKFVCKVNKTRSKQILYGFGIMGGFGYLLTRQGNWKTKESGTVVTWPNVGGKDKTMGVSGVYRSSVNYFAEKYSVSNASKELGVSIFKALDSERSGFNDNKDIEFDEVTYRLKLNINTRMRIDFKGGSSRWAKWIKKEDFNPPNLTDILINLRKYDDVAKLLELTHLNVLLLLEELRLKSNKAFFWDWVLGRLENISFIAGGANEVQRSRIADLVQNTILSRVLKTHTVMDHDLYNKCLLVSIRYISSNYDFWLRNMYMYKCID